LEGYNKKTLLKESRRGTSIVNEFAITYWREGCIVLYERREGKVFGRIINEELLSRN
jgi:hypothetical protein